MADLLKTFAKQTGGGHPVPRQTLTEENLTVEIKFINKEQDWANETTRYWFNVDGDEYCIAHQNNDLTLDQRATINGVIFLLPIRDRKIIRALVAHLNKMMRKINPNIKPIQYWGK